MALVAEELVEEWLNRKGYFTIRGVKLGVQEIDLLAVRVGPDQKVERRHIEVQASMRPVSYITQVPKAEQRTGIAADSAKTRTDDSLRKGIQEWIAKKFDHPSKLELRAKLAPGAWSRELVVNAVRHPRELDLIKEYGITVHLLADVIADSSAPKQIVGAAAGSHLLDLVAMAR